MIPGKMQLRIAAPMGFLLLANFAHAADAGPLKVSLCEVLKHPADYSGKNLVVRARVTRAKEGAFLSDRDCANFGIDLWTDPAVRSEPGLSELHSSLRVHSVDATITGVFVHDQYDEVRHRRRAVFKATSAAEIKEVNGTKGR